MEKSEIINRVKSSSLVTLDLEDYYEPGERVFYDLKQNLFQELILKEKDFRAAIKSTDWSFFDQKHTAIGCTADAIIPTWAYMLIAIALKPHAKTIVFGTIDLLEERLFLEKLKSVDWSTFAEKKIVVKGCSKIKVPESIYVEVSSILQPIAASIMFGEACSTVSLFKKQSSIPPNT